MVIDWWGAGVQGEVERLLCVSFQSLSQPGCHSLQSLLHIFYAQAAVADREGGGGVSRVHARAVEVFIHSNKKVMWGGREQWRTRRCLFTVVLFR